MTTHLYTRRIAAGALALSLLVPTLVFAQANNTGNAGNTGQAGGAAVPAKMSDAVMARAKEKAYKEIDRRTKALSDLATRVSGMTKISEEFKKNLNTNVQNQISLLAALKTKIEADTDGATLREDIKSIATSYRIFALVMPQARIAAAADREATLINMLIGLGTKLQARLVEAQASGADIAALAASLADMDTKLKSAQVHAQAAVTSTATLTPDEGDQARMKANTDALKAARAEIVAAHKDLQDARKAADTITKGLRALNSGTAPATGSTP